MSDTSVIGVMHDMMFETQLRSAAAQRSLGFAAVRSIDSLQASMANDAIALVIVDMECRDLDVAEAIRLCRASDRHPHVLAYFPHVQGHLREAADAAGAHDVVPRSAMMARIAVLLDQCAAALRQ